MARDVFLADSTSVSLSSGHVVRGSITSALMPAASRSLAAPSATVTMLLVATMVTSVPARLTSATPNGMVQSSAGTGPFRSEDDPSELQSPLPPGCPRLLYQTKPTSR